MNSPGQLSFSHRLQHPPHRRLNPPDSLHLCWLWIPFFVLFQEVPLENVPSEEPTKAMFPLFCKTSSSYTSHKHDLSLITAWPWRDVESQNLIIPVDCTDIQLNPTQEFLSDLPDKWPCGPCMHFCSDRCSITHGAANLIVDSPESTPYLANTCLPTTSLRQ